MKKPEQEDEDTVDTELQKLRDTEDEDESDGYKNLDTALRAEAQIEQGKVNCSTESSNTLQLVK